MQVCASCGGENPDGFKFCGFCTAPLVVATPQEIRKTVTIVFSDLSGSTAMGERFDSESLRRVMSRYFDEMRATIERHGGTVEKFIGDAVMAVFGIPELREDDALRAVRAAADMQAAQAKLNEEFERTYGLRLLVRTGVNTGEVIAGDPAQRQAFVTGDAVNVAARLEQAAAPGEILVGLHTYRLVRDAVAAEEVEPLQLKGKAERLPAWRLLEVSTHAPGVARRLDSVLVGRDEELSRLRVAYELARDERRPRLLTLLGAPGVGKSRLLEEFLGEVDEEALVLRGHCLSYGDGITWWPLAEMVRDAAAIEERESGNEARSKLELLVGDDAPRVIERLSAAVGLSTEQFPTPELVWAARKLVEILAARRQLVVVIDDIHWAESVFLDAVEHILDAAEEAPALIVCSARRELVENRPEWGAGDRAELVPLEPLTREQSQLVVTNLLGDTQLADDARRRIVEAADGNPLFVEQLLSMFIDEGLLRLEDERWVPTAALPRAAIPPTIQALLAARLDSLDQPERAAIEPASVVGYVFPKEAVRALVPDTITADVGGLLASLTSKQFVLPDPAGSGEEDFRFHHILVRDTVYEGMLKRVRAVVHERFAEWADRFYGDRAVEYEEILGYHLEQAYHYLADLERLDQHAVEVGVNAARRLRAAGERAFARGDMSAAANLLGRAAAVLQPGLPVRLELLPDLGEALLQTGRFDEAQAALREAVEDGTVLGEDVIAAKAKLVQLLLSLFSGELENWSDEAPREIASAIEIFEAARDESGLAKAYRLLGSVYGKACRFGDAADAVAEALEHARLANDVRQQSRSATTYALAAVYGPTPIREAVQRCASAIGQLRGDRQAEAAVLSLLAHAQAMQGSFGEARDLYLRAREIFEELALRVEAAAMTLESGRTELLAGDLERAEDELRHGYSVLGEVGERYVRSTIAGMLGEVLCDLGRFDEAEEVSRTAEELASEDDVESQALWRAVRARVLAHRGDVADAESLARVAVELAAATDGVIMRLSVLFDLAEVLLYAGLADEAAAALAEAAGLAESKGNLVIAGRAAAQLEELRRQPFASQAYTNQ